MCSKHLADLVAAHGGCPLTTAAHHPEHHLELTQLNAAQQEKQPAMTDAAAERVRGALENVLRARARAAKGPAA